MKLQTISILVKGREGMERLEIRAHVCGFLAVHRPVNPYRVSVNRNDPYLVTHVPTGWAVTTLYKSLAELKESIPLLDGPQWEFSNPSKIPDGLRERLSKWLYTYGNDTP